MEKQEFYTAYYELPDDLQLKFCKTLGWDCLVHFHDDLFRLWNAVKHKSSTKWDFLPSNFKTPYFNQMKTEKITATLPVWALGYIFNADPLPTEKAIKVDRFQSDNLIVTFGDFKEEYFAHTNDIETIGGMVVDVECLVLPS